MVGTGLDVFICLVPAPVGPVAAEIQPDKGWKGKERRVGFSADVWLITIPLHKLYSGDFLKRTQDDSRVQSSMRCVCRLC